MDLDLLAVQSLLPVTRFLQLMDWTLMSDIQAITRLCTYIVNANLEVLVEKVPDLPWPKGEQSTKSWTDQFGVERFWILGTCQEADNSANDNCPHTGDGREPHVRHLIDWNVREFIRFNSGGKSCGCRGRGGINKFHWTKISDSRPWWNRVGAKIPGKRLAKSKPHSEDQGREGSSEGSLKKQSLVINVPVH